MLAAQLPPWQSHPDVLLLVALIVAGYAIALARLGPRLAPPGVPPASRFQVTCFGFGTSALLVVSHWPVHDVAEGYLYSVHMVQHLTYAMVVAPLFLLGTPAWLARWILRPRALFATVRFLSRFLPALIVFNLVIVVTHWPAFVDLTLRSALAHFLAHTVIVLSALIVWMPVLSPLPEIPRLTPIVRMGYLFLQSVVPTIPATFLVYGSHPLYRRYESLPKLWGISALTDQRIAGLIMKIGAGLLLWALIAVIFFRWAAAEEHRNRPGPALRDLDRELNELGLRA
ncbi:MAG: cytochrome c oxidase assembly protein [Actinobacteria bacterium]|nr:cytochrome c oxidase assembly protein [Actinomycetota bacterium]